MASANLERKLNFDVCCDLFTATSKTSKASGRGGQNECVSLPAFFLSIIRPMHGNLALCALACRPGSESFFFFSGEGGGLFFLYHGMISGLVGKGHSFFLPIGL